jgi:hypothetical protein
MQQQTGCKQNLLVNCFLQVTCLVFDPEDEASMLLQNAELLCDYTECHIITFRA